MNNLHTWLLTLIFVTLALTPIEAMERTPQPYLHAVWQLAQGAEKGWLIPEISIHIFDNLMHLHISQELISNLQAHSNNPGEVLTWIKTLHNDYGPFLSLHIFKTELELAKISLNSIKNSKNETILYAACSNPGDLDSTTLILTLISTRDMAWDLLSAQDSTHGWTVLHLAAANGYIEILEAILQTAQKFGIADKLMELQSTWGRNALAIASPEAKEILNNFY